MLIKKEIIVNATIEECWKVLGTDFSDAYKWASAINHSEGVGGSFNGASCSVRGCDVNGMGVLKEKLLHFSNESHSLSYQIIEGMPSMVKKGTNSWKLVSLKPYQTRLTMDMEIEMGGFVGTIMKPIMKMQMGTMGNQLTEEFKYYVEEGKPHPRKLKA